MVVLVHVGQVTFAHTVALTSGQVALTIVVMLVHVALRIGQVKLQKGHVSFREGQVVFTIIVVFVQVAFVGVVAEQLMPSPIVPGGQHPQNRLPGVFVHVTKGLHPPLLAAHSLMSTHTVFPEPV
jgi:hypothetical protein